MITVTGLTGTLQDYLNASRIEVREIYDYYDNQSDKEVTLDASNDTFTTVVSGVTITWSINEYTITISYSDERMDRTFSSTEHLGSLWAFEDRYFLNN